MILDGAIAWGEDGVKPAAKGFDLTERKNDLYAWVRQVRGGILAGAFTIETHLSATIIYFFLGDRVGIPEVHDTFDEGVLGPLTFERRINLALMVAAHVLPPEEVTGMQICLPAQSFRYPSMRAFFICASFILLISFQFGTQVFAFSHSLKYLIVWALLGCGGGACTSAIESSRSTITS